MKIFSKIAILFFIPILIFCWGDKGHKKITAFAFKLLPSEINFSDSVKEEIINRSVDPDYRKKEDPTEPNKHFIDIDYYKEFLEGRMIQSYDSLKLLYPDSVITDIGILPWATIDTYQKLVNAFKSNNKSQIILYGSDLAHYIADGHQPLHTTLNYNGQLTSQKGIHFRYEIEMFDKNLDELDIRFITPTPKYVKNVEDFIFDYITKSNTYVELILSADKSASKNSKYLYDDEYYRALWFRTKYITSDQINTAAYALASLIYSAWIDSGKPINKI